MQFGILLTFFTVLTRLSIAQELPPLNTKRPKPDRFNFTFTGRIVDAQTTESLPFAYVGIRGTRLLTQTNVDGYFTLLNVPADTVTVAVSYLGYKDRPYLLEPSESVKQPIRFRNQPVRVGAIPPPGSAAICPPSPMLWLSTQPIPYRYCFDQCGSGNASDE